MSRFMSPDPLPWLGWQQGTSKDRERFVALLREPQSLNLYAYVNNNPLNRTDPTGMYICNGNAQQCDAVQNSLDATKRAADELSKGTEREQKLANKLNAILSFYGKAGVDNGVKVGFADLASKNAMGQASSSSHFFGLVKTTTITFDYNAFNHGYATGAEVVVHEGAHGIDGPIDTTFWGRAKWSSVLATETHAYQAEAAVDEGLRVRSRFYDIDDAAKSNAVFDCIRVGGCYGQPPN